MSLGTTWTAPAEGSTIWQLYAALADEIDDSPSGEIEQAVHALAIWDRIVEARNRRRATALLLTGDPLTEEDVHRIGEALDRVGEER